MEHGVMQDRARNMSAANSPADRRRTASPSAAWSSSWRCASYSPRSRARTSLRAPATAASEAAWASSRRSVRSSSSDVASSPCVWVAAGPGDSNSLHGAVQDHRPAQLRKHNHVPSWQSGCPRRQNVSPVPRSVLAHADRR